MLPPPVRERHCSSPGRPSCGPPRGGRAWLDFFFFFSSGRRKGKRERQWKEGRLAVDFFSFTFPESLSKSFSDASKEGMSPSPSLLRSSRTLPPAASPPRRATLVPLQRPHLLSQPVRAFKEGEKKKSSGDGAARRRGRNPRSHESARCERNVVTQPSLPARLRLSPWFRPPLVERKETREGQTARNDADDALDAALFETKKPKKSHLHLSFSFFFFAGERPGAPQSSTPPACRRLPQQHRPDPLLDPRRRQRPHPGIRGRPGPRPPGEQSVGRKKEKEERERKKKREREREREKERKPQKSRPPQKTQKKKTPPPPSPRASTTGTTSSAAPASPRSPGPTSQARRLPSWLTRATRRLSGPRSLPRRRGSTPSLRAPSFCARSPPSDSLIPRSRSCGTFPKRWRGRRDGRCGPWRG